MSELLPCPFCDGEARLLGGGIIDGIERGYTVECHDCHASTKRFGADNAQEAIEAWNTRHERTCHDEFNGKAWCFKCDTCGCVMLWEEAFGNKVIMSGSLNYCPSCGARVRSEA